MQVLCGTDIVDVKRIEAALKSNARFAEKVFTVAEIKYCESKNAGKYQSYAARFAAKEAYLKALGVGISGSASLADVEVVNDEITGRPTLCLHGGAAETYTARRGESLSVSISHTAETAIAIVVILCGGPDASYEQTAKLINNIFYGASNKNYIV